MGWGQEVCSCTWSGRRLGGLGEKGNQVWAERYGLSAGGVQLLGKQLVAQRGVRGVGAKRG